LCLSFRVGMCLQCSVTGHNCKVWKGNEVKNVYEIIIWKQFKRSLNILILICYILFLVWLMGKYNSDIFLILRIFLKKNLSNSLSKRYPYNLCAITFFHRVVQDSIKKLVSIFLQFLITSSHTFKIYLIFIR